MDLKEIPILRTATESKLRLPMYGKTSKLMNSLNIASTSISTDRVPLPGALRRRSKSASVLKVNTNKQLFNREPLPTITAKNILAPSNLQALNKLKSFTKTNLTSTVTLVRPGLGRRSKSITDLTQNTYTLPAKPMTRSGSRIVDKTANNGPAVSVKRPPNRAVNTGIKRTIPENKVDDQPKPKVSKPAKIPPYDYKARFQHLEGIHIKLKLDHETLKKTFNTYKIDQGEFITKHDEIKARIEYLQSEKENDQKEIDTLKSTNNKMEYSNTQFIKAIDEFKITISKLTMDLKNKGMENEKLQSDLREVKLDFETSNRQILELKELNNNLKTENNEGISEMKKLSEEIVYLKAEVEAKDLERQKLHNDVQDLKGNIRVYCRVRPQIATEDKAMAVIKCSDDTDIEIRRLAESVSAITGKTSEMRQQFTFDQVFDENTTQADIFLELSQLVQSALDGYNVCVFAYGQTGSGKTYTMQGYDADHEGMIPRSLRVIFNYGDTKQHLGWKFAIKASFLEIYNESLNDLLNMENKEHLEICYNEGNGISVRNLTTPSVATYAELQKLMAVAHRNRKVASTDFNLHSSRSHAVTQIHIAAVNTSSKTKLSSTINLVDLAGSESAKTSSQERITETKSINKSLSNLGVVMNALSTGKAHVPYRNSKLTFLLQSCLGGNSKTVMVVHISPNDEAYNESVTSLRFAATVKSIKTFIKKNKCAI